jgi:ADP-ribosylglycohydrolase
MMEDVEWRTLMPIQTHAANSDFADKARGTIFGQAVGDALGLGSEFLTKKQVQSWYPNGLTDYSQFVIDSHREHWTPGEWTDDTDQMLCILDSILSNGNIEILDIAKRIHSWAFNGGRGLGATVLSVLTQTDFLKDPHGSAEKVWEESGRQGAANGAVMRTSILGIWQYNDRSAVKGNAEAVCRITHFDPRCVASCIAVTTAINRLIQGEDDVEKLQAEIEIEVEPIDKTILESLQLAKQADIGALELDGKGIGYTLKATAAGFWVLNNCDSFDQGIQAVVNQAGDADTNAAVAGAMLGARFGYESIPPRLKNALIGHDSLWQRTEQLLNLVQEHQVQTTTSLSPGLERS